MQALLKFLKRKNSWPNWLIIFFTLPRINKFSKSSHRNQIGMKLLVLSNYGESEKIITTNPKSEQITQLEDSLDWNQFHQVVLEQETGDFMEAGGSLEDGLSVLYQEKEQQYVIVNPPKTIEDLTAILILYLDNDNSFKTKYQFE